MWKILSVIAAILSFVSVFYLWGRVRRKVEDDPYYHYGDSLYRGDEGDENHYTTPPTDIMEETMEQEDAPSMVN